MQRSAVAALLAACQPLPHPFPGRPPAGLADDDARQRRHLGRADRGRAEAHSPRSWPGAVAKALLKREIPATDKSTGTASNLLSGRIEKLPAPPGKGIVTVNWRLRDPAGRLIGQRSERIEARSRELDEGDDKVVRRLAEASATALAALLQDEPPAEAAATAGRTRVVLRGITGAPGDGGKSLATAVTAVLKQQDIAILNDPQAKADLYVEGEVAVAPAKPNKQHIKIVWRVRRADGGEIGNVAMENDVPRGLLDGPWGDMAYTIAIAAGNGLAQLVARGSPLPGKTS